MTTIQARFGRAVEDVRKSGITVALNVMTCCRSCTTLADVGVPEDAEDSTPYAWTYAGQGMGIEWRDGSPCIVEQDDRECDCYYDEDEYGEDEDGNEIVIYEGEGDVECDLCRFGARAAQDRPAKGVYFYHGGPSTTAAQAVADAFRAEGFKVTWGDSAAEAVYVTF